MSIRVTDPTAVVGAMSLEWAKILSSEMIIRIQTWINNDDGIQIFMLNYIEEGPFGEKPGDKDHDGILLEFLYRDRLGNRPPEFELKTHFVSNSSSSIPKRDLSTHLNKMVVPIRWINNSRIKAWKSRRDDVVSPSHRQLLPMYYGFGVEFRRAIEAAAKQMGRCEDFNDSAVYEALKSTWARWTIFAQENWRENMPITERLPI